MQSFNLSTPIQKKITINMTLTIRDTKIVLSKFKGKENLDIYINCRKCNNEEYFLSKCYLKFYT